MNRSQNLLRAAFIGAALGISLTSLAGCGGTPEAKKPTFTTPPRQPRDYTAPASNSSTLSGQNTGAEGIQGNKSFGSR